MTERMCSAWFSAIVVATMMLLFGFVADRALGQEVMDEFKWTGEGDGIAWSDTCNWQEKDSCDSSLPVPGEETPFNDFAEVTPTAPTSILVGNVTVAGLVLGGGYLRSGELRVTLSVEFNDAWLYLPLIVEPTANGVVNYMTISEGGRLMNEGQLLLQGDIDMEFTAEFHNSGTLLSTDSVRIHGKGCCTFGQKLINSGRIQAGAPIGEILGESQLLLENLLFTQDGGTIHALEGSSAVVLGGENQFINGPELTGGGIVRLTGVGTNTIDGDLYVRNGTTFELARLENTSAARPVVRGAGTFSGGGIVDWRSGTMQGTFTVDPSVDFRISGSDTKTLLRASDLEEDAGRLTLQGHTLWTGEGELEMHFAPRLINEGTLTARSNASITGAGCCVSPAEFYNRGTLAKIDSTGVTGIRNLAFVDSGTVDVQTGILELGLGPHRVLDGAVFSGSGRTRIVDGTIQLEGDAEIENDATVELSAGTRSHGGQIDGEGTLTGSGTFEWSGGTVLGNLTLGSSLQSVISTSSTKYLKRSGENSGTLVNVGEAEWTGGPIQLSGAARFVNDGVFAIKTDTTIYAQSCCVAPHNTFLNQGTLTKSDSAGTTRIHLVEFINDGEIELEKGVVHVTRQGPGFVQNLEEARTVLLGGELSSGRTLAFNGGTVRGFGTLRGDVVSSGKFQPGDSLGALQVEGDFRQTSAGTTEIQIGGRDTDEFDRLTVSGTARFDGRLNIHRFENFDPDPQDAFPIIRFGSREGSFARVDGLAFTDDLLFRPFYDELVDDTLAIVLRPSPPITVTSPVRGELLMPGTTATVTWMNREVDEVNIVYGLDFDPDRPNEMEAIAGPVEAATGSVEWQVPSGISPRVRIQVQDVQTNKVIGESGSFRIKDARLTRITADSTYEAFAVGVHTLPFGNVEEAVWPQEWWEQFDYADGTDPFTGEGYPSFFSTIATPSTFPDWPLFAEVFRPFQTYISTQLALYSPSAIYHWRHVGRPDWRGSCHGFSYSALLAFEDPEHFAGKFPAIGEIAALGAVPLSDASRLAVNQLHLTQFGRDQQRHDRLSFDKSPVETLREIEAMLLSDDGELRDLAFYQFDEVIQGHSVVPYRVEYDPELPNIARVFVYDSNNHTDSQRSLIVDTLANEWFDPRSATRDTEAFYLGPPASLGAATPILHSPAIFSASKKDAADYVLLLASTETDLLIEGRSGATLRWSEGGLENDLPGAVPIIPRTGYPHPPIGYTLDDGTYRVSSAAQEGGTVLLTAIRANTLYSYERAAASGQTDVVSIDESITVANPDDDSRLFQITAIKGLEDEERLYVVSSLLAGDDSVNVHYPTDGDLTIQNLGFDRTYTITLRRHVESSRQEFAHQNISLAAGSIHRLEPDWSSLSTGQLHVHVDADADGTADAVVVLENQATEVGVVDERPGDVIGGFALSQNAPNPFHGETTIRYTIGSTGYVRLAVYNMLGQSVRDLVNHVQPAGHYELTLAAGDLPSGVYLYRLEVDGQQATRQMVLRR